MTDATSPPKYCLQCKRLGRSIGEGKKEKSITTRNEKKKKKKKKKAIARCERVQFKS